MAAGHQSPPTSTRSVEKSLDDAQSSCRVELSNRKLNEYPKIAEKYDLVDTVDTNLSKNRLTEVPTPVCQYVLMERLNCYHNAIRSLPQCIDRLQCLTYLNLSRNQLSNLPPFACELQALEVLLISNNKLVSLPEEIGQFSKLMELDVSCNEINAIPSQIGDLNTLKILNLRKNLLVELPVDISRLKLKSLNFSCNKIQMIPMQYRNMDSLEELILDNNPLISPPAYTCTKGRVHTMKYLHNLAAKEDKRRGIIGENGFKRDVVRRSFQKEDSDAAKNRRRAIVSVDSGFSDISSRWSVQIENGIDAASLKAGESPKELGQERHLDLQKRTTHTELSSSGKPPPHTTHTITKPIPDNGSISPLKTLPTDQHGITDMFAKISSTLDLQYDPQELQRQKQEYEQKKKSDQIKSENIARRTPGGHTQGVISSPGLQTHNSASSLRNTPPRNTPPRTTQPISQTNQSIRDHSMRPQTLEVSGYYSSRHSAHGYVAHASEHPIPNYQSNSVYRTSNGYVHQSQHPEQAFYRASTGGTTDSQTRGSGRLSDTSQTTDRMSSNDQSSDSHRSSPISCSSQDNDSVAMRSSRTPNSEPSTSVTKKHARDRITNIVSMNSPTSKDGKGEMGKSAFSSSQLPLAKGKRLSAASRGRSMTSPLLQQVTKKIPVRDSSSTATKQSVVKSSSSINGSSKSSSSALKFGFQSPASSKSDSDLVSTRHTDSSNRMQDALDFLRENIESRLKVTLPDDLSAALRDGVVLCHLANHIKPRTVSQIHVPSTAVPKLSMAKCKRNVENFLDACRRLGISQEQLCSAQDILEEKRLSIVARTVQALIELKNRVTTGASRVSTPRSSSTAVVGSRSSYPSSRTPTAPRRSTTKYSMV